MISLYFIHQLMHKCHWLSGNNSSSYLQFFVAPEGIHVKSLIDGNSPIGLHLLAEGNMNFASGNDNANIWPLETHDLRHSFRSGFVGVCSLGHEGGFKGTVPYCTSMIWRLEESLVFRVWIYIACFLLFFLRIYIIVLVDDHPGIVDEAVCKVAATIWCSGNWIQFFLFQTDR